MKTFNDLQPGDNIYNGGGHNYKITRIIPTENGGKRIYFEFSEGEGVIIEKHISLSPEQIKETTAVPFGEFSKPYFTCQEAYDKKNK